MNNYLITHTRIAIDQYWQQVAKVARIHFSILLSLLILSHITACSSNKPLSPPFNLPFNAQYQGETITVDFEVDEERVYRFYLNFFYPEDNAAERAYLGKLIRQNQDKKGLSIPLHLTLQKQQGEGYRVLVDEEFAEQELISWGGHSKGFGRYRKLIMKRRLKQDRYRLNITSLASLEDAERFNIKFSVSPSRRK